MQKRLPNLQQKMKFGSFMVGLLTTFFVSVLARVVSYQHRILFSLKSQYSYEKLLTFYFLKNF